MNIENPIRYFPYGRTAILIEWKQELNLDTNRLIHALSRKLISLEPVEETVPAYSSLLVILNNHIQDWEGAVQHLSDLWEDLKEQKVDVLPHRTIHLPICYDPRFALDLPLYHQKGITTEQLIELHSSRLYHVYMIGFLPGFPYMGSVHPDLILPRLNTPREKIQRGSCGIADQLTGIYPQDSPGGWNIIGRTPIPLFDMNKSVPSLIQPGDTIDYYAIDEEEYFYIKHEVHQGRYDPSIHIEL